MSNKGGVFSGGRGAIFALVMFAVAAFLVYKTLFTAGPPTPELIPVMFMCSETGKTFEYTVREGDHWPVVSPFTNKKTGYPVERCFWTRDGKRKPTPTYVILNENLGKKGDTICPDCGRIVIGHNPPPPPDVPLVETAALAQPPAAKAPAPAPAEPPKAAQPVPSSPGAQTPNTTQPSGSHLSSKTAANGQTKAQAEGMMYATIRAKMDEMIAQRSAMLKEGRPATDPALRQLEDAILRAQQLLKQHGEHVPDMTPPITPQPASAPA